MTKTYEKRAIDLYPLISPVPAAVVTVSDGERVNALTISWIGVVCSEPPMIAFSVRGNRHSYDILRNGDDFTVNIPTAENLEAVKICGSLSGKDGDKFKKANLTLKDADKIDSPLINEFPINIECFIQEEVELGSHVMFIGEVIKTHVAKEFLLEDDSLDIDVFKPLGYIPKSGYYVEHGKTFDYRMNK